MPGKRPTRHFTSATGWINDPVALTFHDGEYHLFFQAIPGTTTWTPGCHWGHATSTDLVTWKELEPALSPGDGDEGCWSGSLVVNDDEATVFYTSVSGENLGVGAIRVARPADPTWRRWLKGDVVVPHPPGQAGVTSFRDPFVFRDGDCWRMVVGAGLADGSGAALSYSSADLATWDYNGILASRHVSEQDPAWTGSIWECPQLFTVDGVWFLVISVLDGANLSHVAYTSGDYSAGRFTAGEWRRLTYGDSYYAASTFLDRDGNRGLVFWLRGVGGRDEGWAGAISVPYLLSRDGNQLRMTPHPLVPNDIQHDGGPVRVLADAGVVEVLSDGSAFAISLDG